VKGNGITSYSVIDGVRRSEGHGAYRSQRGQLLMPSGSPCQLHARLALLRCIRDHIREDDSDSDWELVSDGDMEVVTQGSGLLGS
jgi:hypothetical protein